MTTRNWAGVGLALMLAATGCSSTSSSSTSGYGHVGPEVVALYDQGDPEGIMELEIDRHGVIYEAEADIDPSRLPANVVAAAEAIAGEGATITGAEIEYGATGMAYEVKMRRAGVNYEYVIDASGQLREQEREIDRAAAPAGIVDAGLATLPGDFESIEILELGGGEFVYHVKTTAGDVSYKAVIAPDGRVLRAVREAHAEIEIPLPR